MDRVELGIRLTGTIVHSRRHLILGIFNRCLDQNVPFFYIRFASGMHIAFGGFVLSLIILFSNSIGRWLAL